MPSNVVDPKDVYMASKAEKLKDNNLKVLSLMKKAFLNNFSGNHHEVDWLGCSSGGVGRVGSYFFFVFHLYILYYVLFMIL